MKALQGQSVIDLAIQTAGTAEAAILVAIANDMCLTDDLATGSSLTDIAIQNTNITTYFSNKNLKPATAISTASSSENFSGSGIGYWIIETNFVVS